MTGFDGLRDPVIGSYYGAERRSGVSFLEKAFHAIGKPEELITRAIGSVLSDDPKYSFKLSSEYGDQRWFGDLAASAVGAGTLATGLGVLASLANPLDPINKLRVGGLTAKGVLASKISKADNLKEIIENGVKMTILDDASLLAKKEALTKARTSLDEAITKASPEDASKLTKTSDSIKNQLSVNEDVIEGQKRLNETLLELQRKGTSFEEIKLAPTLWEQARRQQRRFLGYSRMGDFGHIPFIRGDSEVSELIHTPSALDEVVFKGAKKVGEGLLAFGKGTVGKVIDGFGGKVIKTKAQKQMLNELIAIKEKAQGAEDLLKQSALRLENQTGLTKAEAREVLVALEEETGDPTWRALIELTDQKRGLQEDIGKPTRAADFEQGYIDSRNKERQLLFTPSGINNTEVEAIKMFTNTSKLTPTQLEGGHTLRTTQIGGNQYAIVELGGYTAGKTQDELAKIYEHSGYGTSQWRVIEHAGKRMLAQKLLDGATAANEATFTNDHLINLEKLAASLARRHISLSTLDPAKDLMVTPFGGVQIINPTVYTTTKTSKDARWNSMGVLTQLAFDLHMWSGDSLIFPYLSAKGASKTAGEYKYIRPEGETEGVSHVDAYSLLERAVNTELHRAMLRGIKADGLSASEVAKSYTTAKESARANNVLFELNRMQKQIEQGLKPSMDPVQYIYDKAGGLWIVDGADRATAAKLLGIPHVPIAEKPFVGLIKANAGQGYKAKGRAGTVTGFRTYYNVSLEDAFDKIKGAKPSEQVSIPSITDDYRLLDNAGGTVSINTASMLNPEYKAKELALLSGISRMLAVIPRMRENTAQQAISAVYAGLIKTFGDTNKAATVLADLVKVSDGKVEVLVDRLNKLLQPITKQPRTISIPIHDTRYRGRYEEAFNNIQLLAADLQKANSELGIFTEATLKDPIHVQLYTKATGNTVYAVDRGANSLTLTSNTKQLGDLRTLEHSLLSSGQSLSDLDPYGKVYLYGKEGSESHIIGDLIEKHPRAAGPAPIKTLITDEAKAEFAKSGIFVNPTKADMDKLGVSFGLIQEGAGAVFLINRAGDLFVSANHNSVDSLAHTIFGEAEGAFGLQEFGQIKPGLVTVSNPYGSLMRKLGAREIGILESRIRDIARKFQDLGLRKETELRIFTPFDDGIWKSIYGEKRFLDGVASKRFKLEVPENLKNTPLDITYEQQKGVVQLDTPQLAPKLQKVFDWVKTINDETIRKDLENSIDVLYRTGYFARVMTAEAKNALDIAFQSILKKNPKRFSFFTDSVHYKHRRFSDLTTPEINEIFSNIKLRWNELIDDRLDAGDVDSIKFLANSFPDGLQFFHDDPIYATVLRAEETIRTDSEIKAMQTLAKFGAIFKGTTEDIKFLEEASTQVARNEKAISSLSEKLSAVSNEIAELEKQDKNLVADHIAKLTKEKDSINQRLLKRYRDLNDNIKKRNEFGGLGAGNVDPSSGVVWLKSSDAKSMILDGTLTKSDMVGDLDSLMVQIPYAKYSRQLAEGKKEVILLSKDAEDVALRVFGDRKFYDTNSLARRVLDGYDYVLNLFKNWTLFPVPAYHVRNILSNMYMSALGGINDFESYATPHKILKLTRDYVKGATEFDEAYNALDTTILHSESGAAVTARELYAAFQNSGGISGGLSYNEFNTFNKKFGRNSEFDRHMVGTGRVPSSELNSTVLLDNTIIRGGKKAASYIENHFRFAAFYDGWKKSGSFEMANLNMKKLFYNYGDLNAFERNFLKRVIPFYTWSRYNIPRMLETFVTNPVFHARFHRFTQEWQEGKAGAPLEESDLPDFLQNKYGITIGKSPDGRYYVRPLEGLIPAFDAIKLVQQPMTTVWNGVTPFLKIPIEQYANESAYTGKTIENFPGQPARSYTLSSLGLGRRSESIVTQLFRPGAVVTKLLDTFMGETNYRNEKNSPMASALYDLVLGRVYTIDPEETRLWMQKNNVRAQQEITGQIRHYMRVGDQRNADALSNWLTKIRLEK